MSVRHPLATIAAIAVLALIGCGTDEAEAPAPQPAPSPPSTSDTVAAASSSITATPSSTTSAPTSTSSLPELATDDDVAPDFTGIKTRVGYDKRGEYYTVSVGKNSFQFSQNGYNRRFFEPYWTTYVDGQPIRGQNCSAIMTLSTSSGQVFEQFRSAECTRTTRLKQDEFEPMNDGLHMKKGEEDILTMTVKVETPDGQNLETNYEFFFRVPN